MNIHEHQAKEILKEFGAPVSNGVVIFSVKEIKDNKVYIGNSSLLSKINCFYIVCYRGKKN